MYECVLNIFNNKYYSLIHNIEKKNTGIYMKMMLKICFLFEKKIKRYPLKRGLKRCCLKESSKRNSKREKVLKMNVDISHTNHIMINMKNLESTKLDLNWLQERNILSSLSKNSFLSKN